jgi:CBS domain-containing protein
MQVKDIMTPQHEALQASATLLEAAKEMDRRGVSALPIAEGDRLVGILSERDLVLGAVADEDDPKEYRVADVLRPETPWCREHDDLSEVVARMVGDGFRRILVLGEGERLVGVLSLDEALQAADAHAF